MKRGIRTTSKMNYRNSFIGPNQPLMVYQTRKAELPSEAMASGNRTGCGVQPTTMRKICSEGRQLSQMDEGHQLSQMDENLMKLLEKVRQKLIKEEAIQECLPGS